MSKIGIKFKGDLLVSEEVAQSIKKNWLRLKEAGASPSELELTGETVQLLDGGYQFFNYSQLDGSFLTDNDSFDRTKKRFENETEAISFHNLVGHGKFKPKIVDGYGLLDVETQFIISTGQATLEEGFGGISLRITNKPPKKYSAQEWADLWEDYTTNYKHLYE